MNLQPLKIPRGYRGDWPVQEYALIDAVESVITEVELARGSNASLAEELEETYATKSYVQLAVLNPNVNDIYVSDLSVKGSEQGKHGYSLQVNGAGNLVFANTYELGNGTLAAPSLYFSDNVDAGIFVNYSTSVEDFNIKVSSGIIAKFSHNKLNGENKLIFGNLQLSSGGDISGIHDLTSLRRLVTTGTGLYASNLAEANIGIANIGTLNITSGINFGTIMVLDAQDLNTLPNSSINARTTNTCTNTPEVSTGYLNHYWSGAGQTRQTWVSSTTGYLYERVNNGTWTKYAKVGGDSSQTFNVATATSDTHAVTKLTFDNAVSSLQTAISNEATARSNADTALQTAISNEATARINADTILQTAINGKANTAGSSTQTFSVATATANDHAVRKEQLDAKTGISTTLIAGIVEKATQGEMNIGAANVWPDAATIFNGFERSSTYNGYIQLPEWMGGLIIQWGSGAAAPATTINFPYPFPLDCFVVVGCDRGSYNGFGTIGAPDRFGFVLASDTPSLEYQYIAIGR